MDLGYIIQKIEEADFVDTPFRHIYLENLFSPEDFARIISAPEIRLDAQQSDAGLFDALFQSGYKIIEFPGCITDRQAYIDWHDKKSVGKNFLHSACEGFGVTLRLMEAQSPAIGHLHQFLNSEAFQSALAKKFGVDQSGVLYDAGIQKYLDGYEISPHPDIRKKALTYMVNINPAPDSEALDHHTHYMRLRDPYKYVQSFWAGNEKMDRCWVPWDWCETASTQPVNNSIVIFAPSNDTLHAVKASYDHLTFQRTQLYGNFWFNESKITSTPAWEDFVIREQRQEIKTPRQRIAALLPAPVRKAIKGMIPSRPAKQDGVEKRFYHN
jgi:hypothetical protein